MKIVYNSCTSFYIQLHVIGAQSIIPDAVASMRVICTTRVIHSGIRMAKDTYTLRVNSGIRSSEVQMARAKAPSMVHKLESPVKRTIGFPGTDAAPHDGMMQPPSSRRAHTNIVGAQRPGITINTVNGM